MLMMSLCVWVGGCRVCGCGEGGVKGVYVGVVEEEWRIVHIHVFHASHERTLA